MDAENCLKLDNDDSPLKWKLKLLKSEKRKIENDFMELSFQIQNKKLHINAENRCHKVCND